jgi:hypothetical protein
LCNLIPRNTEGCCFILGGRVSSYSPVPLNLVSDFQISILCATKHQNVEKLILILNYVLKYRHLNRVYTLACTFIFTNSSNVMFRSL